jgi:hypothetical protein
MPFGDLIAVSSENHKKDINTICRGVITSKQVVYMEKGMLKRIKNYFFSAFLSYSCGNEIVSELLNRSAGMQQHRLSHRSTCWCVEGGKNVMLHFRLSGSARCNYWSCFCDLPLEQIHHGDF